MTQTRRKYDLIVFALTDSLVKVSSLSQLRLENYLFTRESIERAYALLNEHGNVVFYNFYRLLFVAQKIYNMIELVTEAPPKILAQQNDFVMLCGEKRTDSGEARRCRMIFPRQFPQTTGLSSIWKIRVSRVCISKRCSGSAPSSPVLAALHFGGKKSEEDRAPGLLLVKIAFVFMGIAFLLLETKSVIQFSPFSAPLG